MIGDGVPEHTLERWVSDDFNNGQELAGRLTSELARANARHYQTTASGAPTAPLRSHLASGLTVQQSAGATITVGSGLLAQQITSDPPLVPTPEALDSSYRVGLNLSTLDATDPWDATGSFWLLEGRVERVTTLSEVRDIYNPTTSVFSPSASPIAKRYESRLVTQWTKHPTLFATQLPQSTAGWAPLGSCWRPAIGGAITDADVFNLSVQIEDLAEQTTDEGRAIRNDFRIRSGHAIGNVGAGFVHSFDVVASGLHCFADTEDGFAADFRHSTIMEASSAVALQTSGVWGYIYLVPLADRMPSGCYPLIHHRGAIVVSRTRPDYFGRNSSPITAPAPFSENVLAGTAVHIGCIQSAGATNWQYISVSSGGEARCEKRAFTNGAFPMNLGNGFQAGPHDLATTGSGGTEDVPYGVAIKGYLDLNVLDDTALAVGIEFVFGFPSDDVAATAGPRMIMATQATTGYVFELHPRSNNLTMTVTAYARNAGLSGITINAANVQGNDYRAGIWGFRF